MKITCFTFNTCCCLNLWVRSIQLTEHKIKLKTVVELISKLRYSDKMGIQFYSFVNKKRTSRVESCNLWSKRSTPKPPWLDILLHATNKCFGDFSSDTIFFLYKNGYINTSLHIKGLHPSGSPVLCVFWLLVKCGKNVMFSNSFYSIKICFKITFVKKGPMISI